MNKLIVLAGVPGSGKSYISLLIKDKMKHGHVYVVSSDQLRTQIVGNQQNFTQEPLMWSMYYELAKAYSLDKNGIVILDSTNAKRIYRINKVKPLKEYFDEVDLVVFELDKLTVMSQNLEREFPVKSNVVEMLYEEFEHVNEEDEIFFDKIYRVNKHDLKPIINDITK